VPHPLYRHIHLDIHHRYEHGPEDWTGPFSYAGTVYPDRPVALWRYLAVFTVRGWRRGIPPVWHDAKTRRDLLVCTVPIVASGAVLGVLDPVGTALFVGFPWVATSVFLPLSNWLQHDGCTFDCAATVGTLNRGLFSQGIGFNIGFHAAHHARPAAHWSKLPALHERLVAADVPVAMIRGGLVSDLRRAGTRRVRVT
jgi:fatty acid desaturase